MSSNYFKFEITEFLKRVKAGKKSTDFKLQGNNVNSIEAEERNSTISEGGDKPNMYVSVETKECSVTVATKSKISSQKSKNRDEDVIVIDSSDESDSSEKRITTKNQPGKNTKNQNKYFSPHSPSESIQSTFSNLSEGNEETTVVNSAKVNSLRFVDSREHSSDCNTVSRSDNTTENNFDIHNLEENYCKYCRRSYSSFKFYIHHRDFYCPFQRKYQLMCKICGVKYGSRYSLSLHLRKVHNVNYYKSKNRSKLEIIVPIDDKKSVRSRKRFRCEHCDGLFPDGLKTRKSHQKVCPRRFVNSREHSSDCTTVSLSSDATKNNFDRRNLEENYCKYCRRSYSSFKFYIQHRDFYCPFQRKYQLMCKICGVKYGARYSLVLHLSKVHNVNYYESKNRAKLEIIVPIDDKKSVRSRKRFRCEHCDGVFPDGLKTRETHQKVCPRTKPTSKTSDILKGANVVSKTSSNRKIIGNKFQCNLCGFSKSGIRGLKIHKYHCRKMSARQLEQNTSNNVVNVSKTRNGIPPYSSELKFSQLSSEEKVATGVESSSVQQLSELSNCENISGNIGNLTTSVTRLDKLILQKRKGGKHRLTDNYCRFCKRSYYCNDRFHDHRDFHCPFQKRFQTMCKLCGKKYTGRNVPVSHLRNIHNMKYSKNRSKFEIVVPIDNMKSSRSMKRFSCEYCNGLFPGLKHVKNHQKTCQKIKYESEKYLSSKEKSKFKKKFQCTFCGQCMSSTKGLKVHNQHWCRKKNKKLAESNNVLNKSNLQNLETHSDNFCNSTNPSAGPSCVLKCCNCNKTFHNAGNLRRHFRARVCQRNIGSSNLISSKSPIYQCKFCSKKFRTNNILKFHISHSCEQKIKVHTCPKCRKQYSYYKSYKYHLKICKMEISQTGNYKVNLHKNSNLPAITNEPYFQFYKCGICDRNDFEYMSLLQKHIQNHDEVNIICTTCKRNFTKYDVFRKHLIKRFEKPFVCGSVANLGTEVVTDFADDIDDNIYEIEVDNGEEIEVDISAEIKVDNIDIADTDDEIKVDNIDNADIDDEIEVDNIDNADIDDEIKVDSDEIDNSNEIQIDNVDNVNNNDVIEVDNHPFVCNVCNRTFSVISLLVEHIHRHLQVEGYVE